MRFFTDADVGRRLQTEETLNDLRRVVGDETDDLIEMQLSRAQCELEIAVRLMRARELEEGA